MKKTRLIAFLAVATCLAPLTHADSEREGGHGRGPTAEQRLMGRYSFRLTPAVSFAPFYSGGGRDSGVLTAPRQDILRVGTFYADHAGNVTGHTIATTDDGATTVVIDFTATVDDTSCTPAQAPGACATFEGPETYAFVVNNHGPQKLLSLIQTDNEGGGAKVFLTGEAQRQ